VAGVGVDPVGFERADALDAGAGTGVVVDGALAGPEAIGVCARFVLVVCAFVVVDAACAMFPFCPTSEPFGGGGGARLRCMSVSGGIGSEMGGSGAVSIVVAAAGRVSVAVAVDVDIFMSSGTPTAVPSFPSFAAPVPAVGDDAGGGKGAVSLAMFRFLPLVTVRD